MLYLKRHLKAFFTVTAAFLLWVGERLWELLELLASWIARLPPLRWYERMLVRLSPGAALAAFLLPGLMLIPFKVTAAWLLTHGHAAIGLLFILAAKIASTTVVTRTFVLCKPQLMQMRWFAWAYLAFEGFRLRIYARVHAMPIYQRVRAFTDHLRFLVQMWLRRLRAMRFHKEM